jgi:hypothetical protein
VETLPDDLYNAIISDMLEGEEIFDGDNQEYFQLIKDKI